MMMGLVGGFAAAVLGGALLIAPGPAQAASDASRELADKHAPILMLKVHDEECTTDGEPYQPMPVEAVLDNPEVVLRQSVAGDPGRVVETGPSAARIAALGEDFALDFPGDALEPGCDYQRDFRELAAGQPAVVYAHVAQEPGHPDKLALQYWFFWYFNDWNNKHEGDWEGIQLVFDASSPEAALQQEPTAVGYAQHEGGERADWDSSKLDRVGARPVVYPSAGSHASYYGSALYLGRSAAEGFGCDNTDGPSRQVDPEVVLLPTSVEDEASPVAWLSYEGRWGERGPAAFDSPTGPATKARWTEPITWQEGLRGSSVVVPVGDVLGPTITDTFCGSVELGSGLLRGVLVEPVPVVATLGTVVLVAAGLALWSVHRTAWTPSEPMPLRRRRQVGQILNGARRFYREQPRALALAGLAYLPISAAFAGLYALLSAVGPVGAVVDVASAGSVEATAIALFVSGTGDLLAFVVVSALVAAIAGQRDAGRPTSAVAAYRLVLRRIGPLLAAFAIAFVLFAALSFTGIGVLVAAFLVIRLQLVPQVLVLDGAPAVGALVGSYRLVARNWFRVAWLVLVANAAVLVLVVGASLLLLILVPQVPLWGFGPMTSLLFAVATPFAAAAVTLLYGDLTARAEAQSANSSREPAPGVTSPVS